MAANSSGWQAVGPSAATGATWRDVSWNLAERTAAAVALAVVTPPAIVLGAAVAILSGRSPLIAHRRVGWRGRTLWMLKFRTMWDGRAGVGLVERVSGFDGPDKAAGQVGVTHSLARWMRRYSIDELPQLWHVITGEMALVGPRPITYQEMMEHYGSSAEAVIAVRPGLTGLWQIRGRSKLTYRQRRRYDLLLVKKLGPGLSVKILLRTLPAVFTGENAW